RAGRRGAGAGPAGPAGRPAPAAPFAPPIDADEEEKPDHIDKMPVPRARLEAEVMVRLEVSRPCPIEADDQEGRTNDDVKPVKPGCHEKRRRVDAAGEVKWSVTVFVALNRGEAEPEKDGQRQSPQQSLPHTPAQPIT